MKRYSNYKDSGVDWLGEIPEHWEVIKIKRLSSVKRGASPRPIDNPKYFDDNGEFAWVRIADVTASNKYLLNTTQTLSKLGTSLSVKQYPGDFFVSIAGSVGKPIITKIKCCIHDGFVYFPQLKINKEFIYYLFDAGQLFKGLGKFGTQLNLNTDTIGNIQIPLPPLYEIDIITYFLDHKLEQINHFISNKQRLIELLKEQKTAIINRAVTKGLNPHAPMKPSGIEWLGEIPEHWEIKRIKDLSFLQSGNNLVSDKIAEIGQYLVYGGNGLRGYFSEYTNEGDYILIGRQGALCGNINYASGKFWATEHAVVVYIKNSINMKWYGEMLRVMNLNQYSLSAAQPGLSVDRIKRLPLPVPSLQEQKEIAFFIDEKSAKIDLAITKIEKEIELIKEYRTTLISDAVTGKIDVRI
jgi:type I restriction enzyme S subunit